MTYDRPAHTTAAQVDERAARRAFTVRQLLTRGCAPKDREVARALDTMWTPDVAAAHGPRPVAATARRWLLSACAEAPADLDALFEGTCAVPPARPVEKGRLDAFVAERLREASIRYYAGQARLSLAELHAWVIATVLQENGRRRHEDADAAPMRAPSYQTLWRAVRRMRSYASYAADLRPVASPTA